MKWRADDKKKSTTKSNTHLSNLKDFQQIDCDWCV